jgi:5-methylcytosine-specific restriction endonuclease McrA|tara:strand:+ start:939 stop:1292 length:354 start_codon:yes stop_codon:yes gene_type:complete
MFNNQNEPLALLLELTPKLAKRRFRESIYEAWNYKCAYCESPATSLDHVIPRFKSGPSNRNNLVPCCRKCNANKASQVMQEWYEQQESYTPERYQAIVLWTEQEAIEHWISPSLKIA